MIEFGDSIGVIGCGWWGKNIIKTFKSSGLKYLYIEGNILVKRKT